jgi:inhibitor of cysteine peptidase
MLLLVSACGDDNGGAVEIDIADSGGTITLAEHKTLELRLEANPTTGYQWIVLEPGVVALTSESYEAEGDLVGAGGVTTFHFTPTTVGRGELRLGYLRPWEEGVEPIDVYTITVEITE